MTTDLAVRSPIDLALPDYGNAQFDAPPQSERRVVYWMNGSPQQRKAGGIGYTGGWCIGAENLNPDLLTPSAWEAEEMVAKSGDRTFHVYVTPVIRVAMLGWRESWVARERPEGEPIVYYKHYADGLTSYVEIAAIADTIKGGIVLTAKGMNSKRLKDCYGKAVTDLNVAFKRPVPPYAFYMALGGELSKDNAPVFTAYGKGDKKSSVVHISPRWEMSGEYLKSAQTPPEVVDAARQFMVVLSGWKEQRFSVAPIAPDVIEDNSGDGFPE